MALPTPTLLEIQAIIVSDLETKFSQTIPLLPKSVWRIVALIIAGVWIILFKYGSDAFKQRFPQTANDFWLEVLGQLLNVFRQAATTWTGQGDVVSTTTGTLVPGTQFIYNKTGQVYLTTAEKILTVGTLTLDLKAGEGGALGDLQISDVINFVSPVPGLAETVDITVVTIDGEDREDREVYRRRVLDAYQKKPQGGASADYEQWSNEAPNVINSYPYPGTRPNQVFVYIEVDNQTDGIPTAPQLVVALAYINFDPVTGKAIRRQVGAEVSTIAISRRTFDVKIVGLSPDTSENRAAIDDALAEHFLEKAPYILGLTITRKDTISQAETQSIVTIVVGTLGATISSSVLSESGTPVDQAVLGEGEKAKGGSFTYV